MSLSRRIERLVKMANHADTQRRKRLCCIREGKSEPQCGKCPHRGDDCIIVVERIVATRDETEALMREGSGQS